MWSFLLFLPSSWWLVAGEAGTIRILVLGWCWWLFLLPGSIYDLEYLKHVSDVCGCWMLTMFNNVNGSKLLLCSENINVHTSNIQCIFSNFAYMSGIPLQILMLIVGDLARCCIAPVSRHHSGCHVSVTYQPHQSRSHHRDSVTRGPGKIRERLQTYFLLIQSWLC